MAVFALACGTCGGCATTQMGSIRPTGEVLMEGTRSWRNKAHPEDQAVIDDLAKRADAFIHIIPGDLSGRPTRGGASSLADNEFSKKLCLFHPKVEGIAPEGNWDVIYDAQQREKFEKQTGIPNSIEPILQHEILGHIVPVLRDPRLLKRLEQNKQLKDENERNAGDVENRYRRHVGLPEVPADLSHSSGP